MSASLLLAGCGGVDDRPSADEPAAVSPERSSPSGPSDPSEPATGSPEASPSTTPSPRPRRERKPRGGETKIAPSWPMARPDGSRTHLLAADALPGYTTESGAGRWSTVATGPEQSRPVGACQKASLVDIGALHAVVRSYAGDDSSGMRARQVVARYADPKSAWRAHQVLRAWRDDCEEWLDRPRPDVSEMVAVTTPAGTGAHYRASFGTKQDPGVAGLGIVRKGKWLSIVAVTDVSPSWTRRAVRRIAATF